MSAKPTAETGAPPAGVSSAPRLSMRGGAMVMKGVTLFLQNARGQKPTASQTPTKPAKGKKRMSEKDSYKCSPKILETMKKETLLSRNEIEALYKIYKKLVTLNRGAPNIIVKTTPTVIGNSATVSEGIDRTVFREVLHNTFDIITESMLMDRIFCVWDKLNCGLITLENWFYGMSLFLKETALKQVDYCFAVYDLNGDGYITKDEMFQLLRNCLIKFPQEEDPEESVKDLVDIVLRKIDKDKDGKVSLQDYKDTIAEEPLLLEAFGRCLPSERSIMTFLTTLKSEKYC